MVLLGDQFSHSVVNGVENPHAIYGKRALHITLTQPVACIELAQRTCFAVWSTQVTSNPGKVRSLEFGSESDFQKSLQPPGDLQPDASDYKRSVVSEAALQIIDVDLTCCFDLKYSYVL